MTPEEIARLAPKCQLQLSPDCGPAEVEFDCPPTIQNGLACLPCGKAFQAKFPHAISGLSVRAFLEAEGR